MFQGQPREDEAEGAEVATSDRVGGQKLAASAEHQAHHGLQQVRGKITVIYKFSLS